MVNNLRNKSLSIVLILIFFTLALYWPVQHYEFINYDDQLYITENFRIQNGITFQKIIDTFSDFHTGLWHPLTMISHMVDWQLFGSRADGHHWTSIIFHILNTVLLFFVLRNMTGALWRSAFVAALFAIHPLNVESVVWIAERKNVLSTFFWFLAMLFYGEYAKKHSWKLYLCVFFSYALAVMSKPMVVTFPFVLLLMDYWPLRRMSIIFQNNEENSSVSKIKHVKINRLILEKVPFFLLSILCSFLTIQASRYVKDFHSLESLPLVNRVTNAIFSYELYLEKLFWPRDLSVFYPLTGVAWWKVLFAAILLMFITFLALKYFRKYPYLLIGWLWFVGTFIPVIGIVQVGDQLVADRYAYITFVGLFVIMVWGMHQVAVRHFFLQRVFVFMSFIILFCFITMSHHQLRYWKDTVTLFEHALQKNSANYLAYQIIALEMAKKGEIDKALQYNNTAIRINPRSHAAYNNRGIIFIQMGMKDLARESFEKALKINKYSSEAYHNLGQFYLDNKDFNKSIFYSLKAIELNPDYLEAYNNLGVAFIRTGKIDDGINQFKKALQINPNYENAKKNLQIALRIKQSKAKQNSF